MVICDSQLFAVVLLDGCHSLTDSDSMVQPEIDQDQFRNIIDLDLVELNQICDLIIYACIRLLLANF